MTSTLYLEPNFYTREDVNPFFQKIAFSKEDNVLILVSQREKTLETLLKQSQKEDLLNCIMDLEEIREKLAEGMDWIGEKTIYIDDKDDDFRKEELTSILNKAHTSFVLARYNSWVSDTKFKLTKAFDQTLISTTKIIDPRELLELVNVYPQSKDELDSWLKNYVSPPANSYYVFNKKPSDTIPAFLLLNSENRKMITIDNFAKKKVTQPLSSQPTYAKPATAIDTKVLEEVIKNYQTQEDERFSSLEKAVLEITDKVDNLTQFLEADEVEQEVLSKITLSEQLGVDVTEEAGK